MALRFNGSTTYALAPDLDLTGHDSISISCWVRNNISDATTRIWIEAGQGTTEKFSYFHNSTDAHFLSNNGDVGSSQWQILSADLPTISTWNHYLLRCDRSLSTDETKIWMNGVLEGEQAANNNNTNGFGANPISFGARWVTGPTVSLFAQVDLAEVAIYAGDISADSAQLTIASPRLVRPDKLLNHWPMWGGGSQDLVGGAPMTTNTGVATDHPPIIQPSAQILQFPPVAAAAGFQAAWARRQSQIIGAGVR